MKNGKIRRFRPRSRPNKHYSGRRSNGPMQGNGIHHMDGQRNNFPRNNVSRNPHNLERIIEKLLFKPTALACFLSNLALTE